MQEVIDHVYDLTVPVTIQMHRIWSIDLDSIGIIDTDGMKLKTRKHGYKGNRSGIICDETHACAEIQEFEHNGLVKNL